MTTQTKKRVAVYMRVSTHDQESGIQSQERALKQFVKNHGWKAKCYRDRISGATAERPGLAKLERAIFMGEVDTVVVWSLDRLTRKGPEEGLALLRQWLEKGVRVVSVREQIDLTNAVGKLVASVLFSIAEMYRENLRANVKRGLANAKARGVKLGRRPTLVLDDVVSRIRQGESIPNIASDLGVTRQGIYTLLKRQGLDVNELRKESAA